MSAKFPRGGAGPFLARSLYTINIELVHVVIFAAACATKQYEYAICLDSFLLVCTV